MPHLPPPVKNLGGIVQGFNELRVFVRSIQPLAGVNTTLNESDNGCVISSTASAAGTTVPPHAFHLEDASNQQDGAQVRIIYGTVGNVAPDGMSPGDDPPYVLPVEVDAGVIYLVISIDEDDFSILDVSIDSSGSMPGDDDTTIYLMIGSFSVDSSGASPRTTVVDNLSGSQWYQMCAGSQPLFGVV